MVMQALLPTIAKHSGGQGGAQGLKQGQNISECLGNRPHLKLQFLSALHHPA